MTTPTSTTPPEMLSTTSTRRGRLRDEYGTAFTVIALATGILLGLWAGTLVANNQRDGCTQLGAVWVATHTATRCVPVGSFTGFLLNAGG